MDTPNPDQPISADQLIRLLLTIQEESVATIDASSQSAEELRTQMLGKESEFGKVSACMRSIPPAEKQQVGVVLNEVKKTLEEHLSRKKTQVTDQETDWIDVTAPGIRPQEGHLHIVTQAIEEITRIFNSLGFTRSRHPEIDWDWYAFESLNMPKHHPARDEWETFFVTAGQKSSASGRKSGKERQMVLTPHTSNGQVREMEKGVLPIRMINIAKCYRRQIDVSHTPMFHQFEGLYIDRNVSIGHLKGVLDYFAMHFFGAERKTRIRPFHFQFTEPSFEVDITCGVCNGTGTLKGGDKCRLCKEGWLELGGAGMVHPNVLDSGKVDTGLYSGFAFGFGIERTYMMKAGTRLDDIRLIYGNDIRFLQQF